MRMACPISLSLIRPIDKIEEFPDKCVSIDDHLFPSPGSAGYRTKISSAVGVQMSKASLNSEYKV